MPLTKSKSFIKLYLHWKFHSVWNNIMLWFLFCPRVAIHGPPLFLCVSRVEMQTHIWPMCDFSNLLWFFWIIIVSSCLPLQFLPIHWLPWLSLWIYSITKKKKISLTSPTVMLCHFSLYLHFWIFPNPQHSQNQVYSQHPTLKCHVRFYTAQPFLETRVVQDHQWLCLRPHLSLMSLKHFQLEDHPFLLKNVLLFYLSILLTFSFTSLPPYIYMLTLISRFCLRFFSF